MCNVLSQLSSVIMILDLLVAAWNTMSKWNKNVHNLNCRDNFGDVLLFFYTHMGFVTSCVTILKYLSIIKSNKNMIHAMATK